MFLGHALLGFALAGGFAILAGWDRERAIALSVVAAAFATAPDIDMVYALVGVPSALLNASGAIPVAESFWETGNLIHRAVTHSLVVAVGVAVATGLWCLSRDDPDSTDRTGSGIVRRPVPGIIAVAILVTLIGVVAAAGGPLAGVITALFALTAVAIAEGAVRRTPLDPLSIVGAALVGMGSHPFGDLLTGEPPALLYPLDIVVVADRVVLHADPTLHLLGAFGVELAAIWLGVAVFLRLHRVSPRVVLSPRATLGAGYAAGALVIPAPTLEVSYPFVFSVLAVGLLGLIPRLRLVPAGTRPRIELPSGTVAVVTGLAAVTVAWAAYGVAYLVL